MQNMPNTKDDKLHEDIQHLFQQEDTYTAEHSFRVAKIAHALGIAMHLCKHEIEMLNKASELHDIGKTKINIEILNKPGRLTDEEFDEVKKHPRYGYLIIKPQNDTIAEIIFAHHERYDGKGYPNGLSGDSIPFLARIIAVADSIDAMSSDRCYRKALPLKTCISEIDRNNGIMYDPDVVNAFHLCQDEISQIISNL